MIFLSLFLSFFSCTAFRVVSSMIFLSLFLSFFSCTAFRVVSNTVFLSLFLSFFSCTAFRVVSSTIFLSLFLSFFPCTAFGIIGIKKLFCSFLRFLPFFCFCLVSLLYAVTKCELSRLPYRISLFSIPFIELTQYSAFPINISLKIQLHIVKNIKKGFIGIEQRIDFFFCNIF